jgi:glutamate racemase
LVDSGAAIANRVNSLLSTKEALDLTQKKAEAHAYCTMRPANSSLLKQLQAYQLSSLQLFT